MNAIIIIACIVGLVWGTVLMVRGSLLTGCFLFLIVSSCFSGDFYSFDAAGLTWSLDRFFLIALAVAFVVQWRLGRTQRRPLTWADGLLAMLALLMVVSTFTHDWRHTIPEEVPVLMHLVNGYLIPLALFWIARNATLNRRNVAAAHLLLACFGVYLAVTALLEISGNWSLVFPRYIADPELGYHFGRARGPMLQSIRLGIYLVVCLSATWVALAWQPRWGRMGRLLVVALVPLYLAAIYFTYTRSVWLGAGLAVLVLLGLTLRGRVRGLVLGGMVTAALVVVVVNGDRLITFQRGLSASDTRQSTYMRASFTYVSWQMFKERPLLGFGFGQFTNENRRFLNDRNTPLQLEAIRGYVHHNAFLCVLVELGVVGLVLYVAVLGCWLRSGWRLWRDEKAPAWARAQALLMLTVMAPYFVQLLFHDVSYSPLENGLVFLLAGITTSLQAKAVRADQAAVPAESLSAKSPARYDWPAIGN